MLSFGGVSKHLGAVQALEEFSFSVARGGFGQQTNESCNVWLLAIPSFGESWHNGHHVLVFLGASLITALAPSGTVLLLSGRFVQGWAAGRSVDSYDDLGRRR